jgi:hypothetical protein
LRRENIDLAGRGSACEVRPHHHQGYKFISVRTKEFDMGMWLVTVLHHHQRERKQKAGTASYCMLVIIAGQLKLWLCYIGSSLVIGIIFSQ